MFIPILKVILEIWSTLSSPWTSSCSWQSSPQKIPPNRPLTTCYHCHCTQWSPQKRTKIEALVPEIWSTPSSPWTSSIILFIAKFTTKTTTNSTTNMLSLPLYLVITTKMELRFKLSLLSYSTKDKQKCDTHIHTSPIEATALQVWPKNIKVFLLI